jgi:hypothetical protein
MTAGNAQIGVGSIPLGGGILSPGSSPLNPERGKSLLGRRHPVFRAWCHSGRIRPLHPFQRTRRPRPAFGTRHLRFRGRRGVSSKVLVSKLHRQGPQKPKGAVRNRQRAPGQIEAVIVSRPNQFHRAPKSTVPGKEGRCLHFDDVATIRCVPRPVIPPPGLDDFPRTDLRRGIGNARQISVLLNPAARRRAWAKNESSSRTLMTVPHMAMAGIPRMTPVSGSRDHFTVMDSSSRFW